MSTPIDDAIEDLLRDLGPGWSVQSTIQRAETGGRPGRLGSVAVLHRIDEYEATIVRRTISGAADLVVMGSGATLGNAIASACAKVLTLRSDSSRRP